MKINKINYILYQHSQKIILFKKNYETREALWKYPQETVTTLCLENLSIFLGLNKGNEF